MSEEAWSRATHPLVPLALGTVVSVQNQRGSNKNKWDNSGVVVECLPFSQYKVRLDSTGRITLKNCVALRRIVPYSTIIDDGVQLEGPSKASLKPKTREVEVGSSPNIPQRIPIAPDVPEVPEEVTTRVKAEEFGGPPNEPDAVETVLRRSSRVRKTPDRLGFK